MVSIEEVQAQNLASTTRGEGAEVPEDIEQVKQPLPPVGHFGYTDEDADAVRQANEERGATVDTIETANAPERQIDTEPSGRGPGVVDASTTTRRRGGRARVADRDQSGNLGDPVPEEKPEGQPAAQSRAGAESKGDDADNTNNRADKSDDK